MARMIVLGGKIGTAKIIDNHFDIGEKDEAIVQEENSVIHDFDISGNRLSVAQRLNFANIEGFRKELGIPASISDAQIRKAVSEFREASTEKKPEAFMKLSRILTVTAEFSTIVDAIGNFFSS